MANVNASPVRFENDGVITITISATPYIVLNYVPGSLKWSAAQRERIRYTDRGAVQTPIEGDQIYGEFSFSYYANIWVSGDIYDKITSAATAATAFAYDTIVFKQPLKVGGTTGQTATWTSCWCEKYPEFQASAGQALDQYTVTFGCKTGPTYAAY